MKKPFIKEVLSKIEYDPSTNPDNFSFVLRDRENYIEMSYNELKEMSEEHAIPTHRITLIRKSGKVIFIRPEHCKICGKPLNQHETEKHKN